MFMLFVVVLFICIYIGISTEDLFEDEEDYVVH